jgi:hypothetical protein
MQKITAKSNYLADSIIEEFNCNRKLWTVLATDEYKITQEQLDVYEFLAGFTQYKTKDELGAIFDLSRRIIQDCDYKRSRYANSVRYIYRELSRATSAEEKLQFRLMREALPDDYEDYLEKLGV